MKTKRILSFIAAVVMLVTMSVVALPASAAAPAAVTDLLAKYRSYDQDLFNISGIAAIQTAITELTALVNNPGDATADIAQAQTIDTTAQAGMKQNLVDGAWVPYSQLATYEVYVKDDVTLTDYAIDTPADWMALVNNTNVVAGKTANRFSGYTFHFTDDIDMQGQAMAPVGYGDEFNGVINGHDHVFKNINLQADSSKHAYIGLVDNVIWGGIQNLGIESGTITVTGTTAVAVGAFAGNLRGAYLRKCWNAASISVQTGKAGNVGGLVGNGTSTAPVIDGCFNVGTITTGNAIEFYGIHGYGGNQATVYNSFAHGYSTAAGDPLIRQHANIMSSEFKMSMANTYSTGNLLVSWNGTVPTAYTTQYEAFCETHTLTADAYTSGELAYKLNQGYIATGKGDGLPFFYTNGNGMVFFGKESNQTRKITFDGAKTDVYYLPANGTYDMNATFGVSAANSAFITTENAASTLVDGVLSLKNEDITIKIINDCEHQNGFTYTAENGKHTKVCKDACGYKSIEPCAAASYTADAITAEELAKGKKATHSGICITCGFDFAVECGVEYVAPADKTQEHYWSFDGCACGRADIENTGSADMTWGDAKVDGSINVLDGIAIIRSTVDLATVNEKNADADADTNITADDAVLIVRAWLGDAESIAKGEEVEAKMNANLFDKNTAANSAALLMDGATATRTNNYVATVEVKAGQTLSFGPVRLGQPVLGYAYDAAGEALGLINYAGVTTLSTLKEGMALVSYTVPAGAASVKVNVPASDADLYALRLNTKMYAAEYGARMGVDPDGIANPLYNKNVLTVGDSICEAARDVAVGGLKGWASSIYQEFDANVTNSGKSGAAFSDCRYVKGNYTYPNAQIYNQIGQHAGTTSFDYILIHGGVNDAWDNIAVGTISSSFDPDTFDLTTFAGGMEMAIYTAVKDQGNTAAIGYHINFAAPYHTAANDWGSYIPTAKAICEKWGIQYVDIYAMEFDTRLYTADYIHPNEEGYDVLGEYINPFMLEMRPVSYEVWNAVQETL